MGMFVRIAKRKLNKDKNLKKLNNKGFSLMEVLVAMIILAIVTLPILSAFATAGKLNSNARKQENANAIAQKMLEEFKSLSITQLTDNNTAAQITPYSINNKATSVANCLITAPTAEISSDQLSYMFNMATISGTSPKTDAAGKVYYEGPSGEKFYVTVTLDPFKYSDKTSAAAIADDVQSNNLNSFDMPSLSDVASTDNFVFQKHIFQYDSNIVSVFKKLGYSAASIENIRKEVTITASVVQNATTEELITGYDATNTAIKQHVKVYSQTVVCKVTYINTGAGVFTTDPYYKKDYEFTLSSNNIVENSEELNKLNPTKQHNKFKDIYLMYNAFDVHEAAGASLSNREKASDKINIAYNLPTAMTSANNPLNIYLVEEAAVNVNGTPTKVLLQKDNVSVSINGGAALALASTGTLNLPNVSVAGGPIDIYSNITDWTSYKLTPSLATTSKNGITQNYAETTTKYLYDITVQIWAGEYSTDPNKAYLTVKSTKEN